MTAETLALFPDMPTIDPDAARAALARMDAAGEKIAALSPMGEDTMSFMCQSGTEAVEGALKGVSDRASGQVARKASGDLRPITRITLACTLIF